MWSTSEEPPGTMEAGPPDTSLQVTETCEQNKSQLESLKEIMLKNKQSLKKKEEEVEEYSSRLLKIKSRTKISRRSKESASASKDVVQMDTVDEAIDDISQATTPKAKSSLLQRKLAENRKVFEQRSKEITESKRAVEEKVEAIRQQLEEKNLPLLEAAKDVTPVVTPIVLVSEVASPVSQVAQIQEMDNEIVKLNDKISKLKATIIDLQENLKEKDSVIDSKTKAIMLMSADLSKKGKTTLDTLEETKDEMRAMQEHFVLLEASLKEKNDSLLKQLYERDNRISELDDSIKRYEHELTEQKLAETAQADLSRSTMNTLADTKDAMKAMQENFVLIESSLKMKNDNLLQQLQDYEMKLAEANGRIFQLESGKGIVRTPTLEDLQYKLDRLEENNKKLQDEKYELQKTISDLQDKILANKSINGNGITIEKDNRIAELENLIEELKKSNDLLREESKAELQKQLAELMLKNDEYSNKITDLESLVHKLETEKQDLIAQLPQETSTSDEKVQQLTKELEELNKTMIKIKAQNRSKVKNLQKQLENFKMVSDANAELVRLGNQVALLEEEKGNLQLSLVDFDELKASAGDWQERIADLESKVSMQTEEMQKHVDAIAILENQKLDLIQELHTVKQKVSSLEAEIADSENHRVTAEMKVVDLEEQLESIHKTQREDRLESLPDVKELMNKIEILQQEKDELTNKLSKIEEKNSDASSTESFETIQELDKHELLKRIEELTRKNDELTLKLAQSEDKGGSHAGSTESFEAINDTDKHELLKKIDQLTQENNDLLIKVNRNEEKGSSDTGSTESFERIPEHNESTTSTLRESDSTELTKLKAHVSEVTEENIVLQKRIEVLVMENNDLAIQCTKLEEILSDIKEEHSNITERIARQTNNEDQINILIREKSDLEKELSNLQERLVQQSSNMTLQEIETNDTKLRMNALLEENSQFTIRMTELEELNKNLTEELNRTIEEKEDLHNKLTELSSDNISRERIELIEKLEKLTQEKESVAQERKELHEQMSILLHKSVEESSETQKLDQYIDVTIVASLEEEIKQYKELIAEQSNLIDEMKQKLSTQEEELKIKMEQMYKSSSNENENLKHDLKELTTTMEEWKFKCAQLQEKMKVLENDKTSIEDGLRMLQEQNKRLFEEAEQKDAEKNALQEQLENTISTFNSKLEKESEIVLSKESEIINLKENIEEKSEELQNVYNKLQREMILLDEMQEKLNSSTAELQEKESRIASFMQQVERLNEIIRSKEDEVHSLERKNSELQEKLRDSVSSKEYERLLEELRDNEVLINNLQSKIDERTKEKHDLLMEIENLSQQNQDLQYQLAQKNEELRILMTIKEQLDVQVTEMETTKAELEKKIWNLESSLNSNSKFTEELQLELKSVYKMMEQLKGKHVEDIEMYQRRLEDIIEELNSKSQECDSLKIELQEKEKLIGQNFTEETKAALEAKIADLESKLSDSENKIQAQLEKMKKIAATLKKKTSLCQELQERVVELEEKWSTEKDEKEARNKKSQEFELSIREKDNRIAELEEKLGQAKIEASDHLLQINKLVNELGTLEEKTSLLTNQITESDKEIETLRMEMDQINFELLEVKQSKQNLIEEYESYKREMESKHEQEQHVLDEVKEKARELSVRMQVMESEYMDQLALIKNLQAENGLLFSKQTQINEKLENVEKESEERRLIIEQLQKDVTETSIATTQTLEEDWSVQDARTSMIQRCDHCEQCQTTVQALEAKLQEREAEIENLDNELANSIGNFVQMRESMRFNDMMSQSNTGDRNLGDSYSDLLLRYNALASSNEETKKRLEHTIKKNEELEENRTFLIHVNNVMHEQVAAVNQEIMQLEEAVDQPHMDVIRKCQALQELLQKVETELQVARDHSEVLNSEKEELMKKYKSSVGQMEDLQLEIASLNQEKNVDLQKLSELEAEVRTLKEKDVTVEVDTTEFKEKYEAPPLFDASKIFGISSDSKTEEANEVMRLRGLLEDKNIQCATVKEDMNNLRRQVDEEKSQILQNYNICQEELRVSQERCQSMQLELENLEQTVVEKTKEINLLNEQMNNVYSRMSQENLSDSKIQTLQSELKSMEETLRSLNEEKAEQNRLLEMYKNKIRDMEEEMQNSTVNSELVRELEERISQLNKEKDVMQLEKNDLIHSLEKSQQINFATVTSQEQEGNLDSSSTEKLNVDEEVWGWNEEDAQLADNRHITQPAITLSAEVQLRTMVEELQDRIKQLETEQAKLIEENTAAQVRSKKLVKKLKEYKVQTESLQQQLKSQGSTAGFYDLDSAIEEELKSQIAELEKSLKEMNEEYNKLVAEKESLLKRLDVVVSANERYMEMKERQDMEMEVLRIQNSDLAKKITNMELRSTQEQPETNSADSRDAVESTKPDEKASVETSVETQEFVEEHVQKRSIEDSNDEEDHRILCNKYKEELDDLKDEMEALATENEQLQNFLEEQKSKINSLETKLTAEVTDQRNLEEIQTTNVELRNSLESSEKERATLKKQLEESLANADQRISEIQKRSDALESEIRENNDKFAEELKNVREQLAESQLKVEELETKLQNVLDEKMELEKQICDAKTIEEKLSVVSSSLADVTELLNARVQEVADLKQELQKQYVGRQEAEGKLQENIQALNQELHEKKQEFEVLKEALSDKENELMQQKSMETVSSIVSQATQELVQKHAIEIEEKNKEMRSLHEKIATLQATVDEYSNQLSHNSILQEETRRLQAELTNKESFLGSIKSELNSAKEELRVKRDTLDQREMELQRLTADIEKHVKSISFLEYRLNESKVVTSKLEDEVKRALSERDTLLSKMALLENRNLSIEGTQLENKSEEEIKKTCNELFEVGGTSSENQRQQVSADSLPVFRMSSGIEENVQETMKQLQASTFEKDQEIAHLKFLVETNPYPRMIEDMQDLVNSLYDQKAELESSLQVASQSLAEERNKVQALTERLSALSEEFNTMEETKYRERRSLQDQEKIMELQNEIHAKEQEINELRYVIAQKDSQLSHQASIDRSSDEYELRETIERLRAELYAKEQEIAHLKSTVSEMEYKIQHLKEFERLSEESKALIERLNSEKEEIRLEAEKNLEKKLAEKEMEIDKIKRELLMENEKLLQDLQLREKDVENLKRQLECSYDEWNEAMRHKEEDLFQTTSELAEKERRFSELIVSKDSEIQNLMTQLHERDIRIEELLALSEKEKTELSLLREIVENREMEIEKLNDQLENKLKEYETIKRALSKDFPAERIAHAHSDDDSAAAMDSSVYAQPSEGKDVRSNELDLALYMLHQRDVRCEELTHELMQLLEERDTLQLRLSNAIRINEELRKVASFDSSPRKEVTSPRASEEPPVEHPSPSKSTGPVEIAKEAIDTTIGEDKEALTLKLSQLHTVGHTKDVRLRDDRELRHTQQMSLLAHKDVLSTLPPEAAARLVNANYTLSRDVQSQSSVLLNWLWGKSTPKVVHM